MICSGGIYALWHLTLLPYLILTFQLDPFLGQVIN